MRIAHFQDFVDHKIQVVRDLKMGCFSLLKFNQCIISLQDDLV